MIFRWQKITCRREQGIIAAAVNDYPSLLSVVVHCVPPAAHRLAAQDFWLDDLPRSVVRVENYHVIVDHARFKSPPENVETFKFDEFVKSAVRIGRVVLGNPINVLVIRVVVARNHFMIAQIFHCTGNLCVVPNTFV
jgi:hypothetical protein